MDAGRGMTSFCNMADMWEEYFVDLAAITKEFVCEKVHKILFGKVSAQPHTIVKQICFPNGNVLFLSLFSLFKN